jgi:tetratricopeptide (TPR) repeat protein
MKALEKDRARRYETANGLAQDVQRHLSNEPVTARPPSTTYRFQKLVRRNKLAFAAAALLGGSLAAGFGTSTWLFLKERAARWRAVAAEKAQSQLHQRVDELYKLYALGNQLFSQGKSAEAESVLREALVIEREIYGADHAQVRQSLQLDSLLGQQGKWIEAELMLRKALAARRKLLGDEHPDVVNSLKALAAVLRGQGKWAEAEKLNREALALQIKLLGNKHPDVIASLGDLGLLVRRQGRLSESEGIFRDRLQAARDTKNNAEIGNALASLALTLLYDKKFAEAEPLGRELLSLNEKSYRGQWYNFTSQSFLGGVLVGQKKYAEAEPLLLSGYAGMKAKQLAGESLDVTRPARLKETLEELVKLYEGLDKPERAAEWKRKLEEFSVPANYSNSVYFIPN